MRCTTRRARRGAASIVAVLLLAMTSPEVHAEAQEKHSPQPARVVQIDNIHRLHVTTSGRIIEQSTRQAQGGCPQEVSSHTDANFQGGVFVVQAGFAEGEIAAVSYQLSAADFPLRIDLMEMIFATFQATVQTTTEWSVMVWEGTPDNGNLVALFSSDAELLPHIILPPGTSGVNVAVSVDPADPEPIIVTDNGSQTFSFGYRIDQHNNQIGTGCSAGDVPVASNAFPTTDSSGLASPAENWIFAIDCGPISCVPNGGWAAFEDLPPGPPPLVCRPTGDWVMRATWTPFDCGGNEPGACCFSEGDCLEFTADDCAVLEGAFGGEGTNCENTECPEACCFVDGGCLNVSVATCAGLGGFAQGLGSTCDGIECFPTGACCLPDGTCQDEKAPDECAALDGAYQGTDSTCALAECPDPQGACCATTGFCAPLTEAECGEVPDALWPGPLTDCTDSDENGTADVCEENCAGDFTGDGFVNVPDLIILLGAWGSNPDHPADFDGDGAVRVPDLIVLLGLWGECP